MDDSRKILECLWNMPDKGELESHHEETCLPKANYYHFDRFTLKI